MLKGVCLTRKRIGEEHLDNQVQRKIVKKIAEKVKKTQVDPVVSPAQQNDR